MTRKENAIRRAAGSARTVRVLDRALRQGRRHGSLAGRRRPARTFRAQARASVTNRQRETGPAGPESCRRSFFSSRPAGTGRAGSRDLTGALRLGDRLKELRDIIEAGEPDRFYPHRFEKLAVIGVRLP